MNCSFSRMSFVSLAAQQRIAEIERVLTDEPTTTVQLCQHLGITRKTLQPYMKWLRPQMHVEDWAENTAGMGVTWLRRWAWGAGDDAAMPKPKVVEPRGAEFGTLRPRRDPLVAAFFGAPAT